MKEEKKSLGVAINCVSNLLRREVDKVILQTHGDELNRLDGWIIHYMVSNQGKDIFQKDLENELALTRSNVSKVVDQMVQKGLILRSPVEHDARLKKLTLTEKALEIDRQVEKNIADTEKRLTEGFTQEELEQLEEYLHRLTENIKRRHK